LENPAKGGEMSIKETLNELKDCVAIAIESPQDIGRIVSYEILKAHVPRLVAALEIAVGELKRIYEVTDSGGYDIKETLAEIEKVLVGK
jgi:hypothetical protein